MKTRDKIKTAAIELFNEKCATNVSTVQLAHYMGLSPGNLYYYFENKEHIIRSIWEEDFVPAAKKIVEDIIQTVDTPETIYNLVDRYLHLVYEYRFIYMELSSLLFNDPLLRQHYRKLYEGTKTYFTRRYRQWLENGLIHSIDKDLLSTLYITQRLSLHSFVTYQILVMGRNDVNQITNSAFMKILQASRPIISEEAYAYLEERLLENNADQKDLI